MGNGEVFVPWLNDWLLRRDTGPSSGAARTEVNKREHPVPLGEKEMQVSQNLFLLEAGADGALDGKIDPSLEQRLITRLKRERDELGLWGSECTSPIYHTFILTGLSAIYHNTTNQELRKLIVDNMSSFFWYAIRMGLDKSSHGLIGMRGTGHDFGKTGFPGLHFVCQYFTSGRPKNYQELSSWKPMLKDSGWSYSGLPGGRNYDLYKEVFENAVDHDWKPWRLRSVLTFVRINGYDAGHFYSKGINGNTGSLMAYTRQPVSYLPHNYSVRMRQSHDNAEVKMVHDFNIQYAWVRFDYTGKYTSMVGGSGEVVDGQTLDFNIETVDILTSSLEGVTGWVRIYPSASVPDPTPTTHPVVNPPKKKYPWWMFWK